ncbi:peptidase domain-containing ABC transporter, partial [Micromonospora sp. HK10]|uniref:peptidase domain-containing ABC transporter n=1 Tax=Micromonospora sp. HK10 TaxID=1538294 RepID=UPI00062703E6
RRWPPRRRVPLVLQMADADCGAACLTMIARWHGVGATLAGVRERLDLGRDGVTARALLAAGPRFGLAGRAFRADPAQVGALPLPAVAHWENAHFVVVEQVGPRGVRLLDPALGRRLLTPEEFAAGFTGTVLTFTRDPRSAPEPPAARPGLRTRLGRARPLVRPFLPRLAAAFSVSLVLQLLGLALPMATTVAFDQIMPARETALMPYLALAIVALVLTQFGVAYLRSRLLVTLQAGVDATLMTRLFGHLLKLPYAFFRQRASGDLMQRLSSSILLRELVTTQVLTAVIDGVLVLAYFAVLFASDLAFAGLAAAIGTAQVVAVAVVNRRLLRLGQRNLTVQADAESALMEALSGIATVKSMGAERQVFDGWLRRYTTALDADVAQNRLSATVANITASVQLAGPLALLWLGTGRLFAGAGLGETLGLQALALSALTPLASLVASAQVLQSVVSHLQRLRDVFAARPEPTGDPDLPAPRLTGRISVRDVTFRYDGTAPPVLRDISFEITPGEKVAVVGPSGSGKSTLAMLLTGLYRPSAGEILFDGVPLSRIDPTALRRQFGVVLQESYLFRDSIRRNVSLVHPGIGMPAIRAAAEVAAIDQDIAAMPMGYDTQVAERGQALSGGQRQRLAIARAVAGQPAVLLLDEATSHLDVATERRVDRAISALRCTRIVVAHRLSTVRNADQILVVADGRIVERGRHDDLLRAGGVYADLVRCQLTDDDSSLPGGEPWLPVP